MSTERDKSKFIRPWDPKIFGPRSPLFFFLPGAQVSCTYLSPPTIPLPHPNS